MKSKNERIETQSEKETFFSSSRVFATPFSFLSPHYDKGKGGNELCDCLLEFQNTYIVFQIKEKTTSKKEDWDWFDNDIQQIARSQIEKTIDIIKEADKHHFYLKKANETLNIHKDFNIVPVIVFQNSSHKSYPRIIFSELYKCHINVFEMQDFVDAFNTLLIPNEILKYLSFRTNLLKDGNDLLNSRFIHFDKEEYSMLIGGGIKDEADLAEIYYQYNYAMQDIAKENIVYYNSIINYIDNSLPNDHPAKRRLVDLFLSVDVLLAIKLSNRWRISIERCSSKDVFPPFAIWLDNLEVLLVSKSASFSDEDFKNYYINLEMLYSYKDHINDIFVFAFAQNSSNQIEIGILGWHNEFQYPNDDMEKLLKVYNENYTEKR